MQKRTKMKYKRNGEGNVKEMIIGLRRSEIESMQDCLFSLIRGYFNITNVIISNFNNFTGSLKGVKLLFLRGW